MNGPGVLSPQRARILEAIKHYTAEEGHSPSIRTIAELIGARSPAGVHAHLKVLEEQGYLRRSSDKSTSLEVNFTGEWAKGSGRSAESGEQDRGAQHGQLTARQHRILEAIRDAVADRGRPPSIREIGEAVGLKSTSVVHSQLKALQRQGYIHLDPAKPRAIEVRVDDGERTESPGTPPSHGEQLTTRQRRILEVIRDSLVHRGYPPSIKEIGKAVGLTSTSSVHSQLEALQRKGFIRRHLTKPRTIEICFEEPVTVASRSLSTYVPLMSAPIAAGTGVMPEDVVEELLPLPRELVGQGQLFMLQVRGESMVGAGVFDRDYVVVRRQDSADNGDLVAALLPNDESEATVKRFSRRGGHVQLLPDNPAFDPSTAIRPRSSARSSRFCDGCIHQGGDHTRQSS